MESRTGDVRQYTRVVKGKVKIVKQYVRQVRTAPGGKAKGFSDEPARTNTRQTGLGESGDTSPANLQWS
jgi:hypothetical protein